MTDTGHDDSVPPPVFAYSSGYGASTKVYAFTPNQCSITVSGPITAAYTWQPDPNLTADPPPSAIIAQTCYLVWDTNSAQDGATGSASGTSGISGASAFASGPSGGGSVTGYSMASPSGSTISASCSPALNYTGTTTSSSRSAVYADASVNYSATVYPVTVVLSGQNPANQALTGQQITASLVEPNGLPSGTKISGYTWSFSGGTKGNPIKNWDPKGVAVDGTTPQQLFAFLNADLSQTDTTGNGLSGVNPILFYDEIDKDAVTVTCAVNLTFPDGTTSSVTAKSVPVTFFKPTASWTASATPPLGPQFDPSAAGSMGFDVQWSATITVPSQFSGGLGCFAQTVQPTIQFQRTPTGSQPTYCYLKEPQQNADGTTTYVLPSRGLDTYFPYQNSLTTNYPQGYEWDVSGVGQSGDAPSAGFNTPASDDGGSNWYNAFASGSFTTYLMYMPPSSATGPGGTIWVPLQTVDWSWTGSVVKNKATGSWNSATNSSPAVTGTTANSGMQTDTPPQWTSTNVGSSVLRP